MGKFTVVDNMIPGVDRVAYSVRGNNVWGIFWSRIDSLARNVLEISGSKIYPKYYYYEDAGIPYIYRYYVRFRRKWDKYTSFWIDLRAWGSQHPQTNEGDIAFRVRPEMVTKFEYNNLAQKQLIKSYYYFYYVKRRNELWKLSMEYFNSFMEELKGLFGVSKFDEKVIEAWSEQDRFLR